MNWKKHVALVVCSVYAVFGFLWILITDWLVDVYFDDFMLYSTVKGLIFVFLSVLIIYFTVSHQVDKRLEIEDELGYEKAQKNAMRSVIQEESRRLHKLIDAAPIPMILHTENKRVIRVSQTFLDCTGFERSAIPTINAWIKKAFRDRAKAMTEHFEKLYTITSSLHDGTHAVYTKDGKRQLWDMYSAYAGTDEHGLRNVVTMAVDRTQMKKYEATLDQQSRTDALTNVSNRLQFTIYRETLDTPYVLLLADINGLKLINDLYGHEKGDALLKFFASLLKLHLPKEATIYRMSGDEFAAILPEHHIKKVENIMKTIQQDMVDNEFFDVQVSASFGHALKDDNRTHEQAYYEAENNLLSYKTHHKGPHSKLLMRTMLHNLFARSDETSDHVDDMMKLARKLEKPVALSDKEKQELDLLIKVHDIGKIHIDPNLFSLTRRLTDEELEEIHRHPEYGYRIAAAMPQLKAVSYAILTHHENIDGSGYPFGLKGKDIPKIAKVFRIIDSYDTMVKGRPYKEKTTPEKAVMELKRLAGTHYDREMVDAFVRVIESP